MTDKTEAEIHEEVGQLVEASMQQTEMPDWVAKTLAFPPPPGYRLQLLEDGGVLHMPIVEEEIAKAAQDIRQFIDAFAMMVKRAPNGNVNNELTSDHLDSTIKLAKQALLNCFTNIGTAPPTNPQAINAVRITKALGGMLHAVNLDGPTHQGLAALIKWHDTITWLIQPLTQPSVTQWKLDQWRDFVRKWKVL